MSDDFVTVSEVKKIIIKDIKSFWGSDWKVPAVVMFIVFIFSLTMSIIVCFKKIEVNQEIVAVSLPLIFFGAGVLFIVSGIKDDKRKLNRLNQCLELPPNNYKYWRFDRNLLVTQDDGVIKIKETKIIIRMVNGKEGEIEYSYNSINWKKAKDISFIVDKCDNFYVRSSGDDFYLSDPIPVDKENPKNVLLL